MDRNRYLEKPEKWLGPEAEEIIEAFEKCFGEVPEHPRTLSDAYRGWHASDEDFAREVVNSTGYLSGVPDHIAGYFDYGAFACDLMHDHAQHRGHYFFSNW